MRRGDFEVSTDKSRLQLDTIHGFLQRSHWAANRPLETIRKSLKHSLCYGVYLGGNQVAFARVVTDYSTFAYLCDVFVDEAYRGLGLSKWMMEAMLARADLQGLRRFLLATKDAHSLYARYGFQPLTPEEQFRLMGIRHDSV